MSHTSEKQYRKFLFEYPYAGSMWGFTLYAQSFEDAEERIRSLAHTRLLGSLEAEIPAGFGVCARLWCWGRNLWKP